MDSPVDKSLGRRRKSDYDYRVSTVETPPMDLVSSVEFLLIVGNISLPIDWCYSKNNS